jgi:hypothetical protein
MKITKRLVIGALASFQILFLTNCASKTTPVTYTCNPPSVYLQNIDEPMIEGKTNKDLVEYIVKLREVIRQCNLDKLHLREWVQETSMNP